MILLQFMGRIFLCFCVIILTNGCSASSSSQRFKQPKNERDVPNNGRFERTDTTKRSTKTSTKNERIIYNDIPTDTSDEFDETPSEENPIDRSAFVSHYEKLKTFNVALTPREKVLFEVIKFLETPYKYGGNTGSGIDCSAFTKEVYQTSLSVDLPRSCSQQYKMGDKIESNEDLKFGDLVFFNTTKRSYPGHVGIYLGENQFVHASRSLGVTVSSLDNVYYKKRYVGARRIETFLDQQ